MSADAEETPTSFAFDVTKVRCPMCGATIDERVRQCPGCGEELQPSTEVLTVPLFSMMAIGLCTFFWSFAAGMLLVWLNCRKLERYAEAQRTLFFGMAMFAAMIVLLFVLPEDASSSVLVGIVSVLIVTTHAKSVLKVPLELQRRQGGPYRSIWLAHGIGILVLMGLLMFVVGLMILLEIAGGDVGI